MKVGYARVSTQEQTLDLQVDALKQKGCENIYTDKVSGVKAVKPTFEKMLNFMRAGNTVEVVGNF